MKAISALGEHAALELGQLVADMEASNTVAEFVALQVWKTSELTPSEVSVSLRSGYALVFRAGHVRVPALGNGGTDWAKVSRIKITALEDADD